MPDFGRDYAYSLQKLLQHRGYDTDTATSLTEAKENMFCHELDDWESEAVQRGASFCLDKMKTEQVKDKLLEYARRESLDAKPAEETCRLNKEIEDGVV